MQSLSNSPPDVRPTGKDWSEQLRTAIRDPFELCHVLGLPEELAQQAKTAHAAFRLLAPRAYVARIRPGDPGDPLLRQILPLGEEMTPQPGFVRDPVGDAGATLASGLLQKYHGRALLVTTGACAVHCRYCFRRHYPYSTVPKGIEAWNEALQIIESDPTIKEVLLSGGDPLMLVDSALSDLVKRIDNIPHVERIRIHTRLPVMIPARVTEGLLRLFSACTSRIVFVVHVNHPNEMDSSVADSFSKLRKSGITLLNQSVLLDRVNDDADTLVDLSEKLFRTGVLPYYLHQLDSVAGASHFAVSLEQGKWLLSELRRRLPGYLVPCFVAELSGEPYKTPLI